MGATKWMSLIKLPQIYYHWSGTTRQSIIADNISKNRWKEIKSHLYFIDPCQWQPGMRKDAKFHNLFDHFNEVLKNLPLNHELSIDEQLIPYKGKQTSLRQYLPKKTEEMGLQAFCAL